MSTAVPEATEPIATGPRAGRRDIGRLIMVPLALVLLEIYILRELVAFRDRDVIAMLGTAFTAIFYAVLIWAYLRRSPARATSTSWFAHAAALTATWLPLLSGLLPPRDHGSLVGAAADVLVFAGAVWAIWSLRTLGASFSLLAQSRELVTNGPYQFVRHPVYLGEIVSIAGVALMVASVWSAAGWLCLVALQLFRTRKEEEVLTATIPAYAAYSRRTKRLIPGIV